jgi:hypothetical protein
VASLGSGINSTANDLRPSLSWDGTALYFGSTRAGGEGVMDLYVTTRSKSRAPEPSTQRVGRSKGPPSGRPLRRVTNATPQGPLHMAIVELAERRSSGLIVRLLWDSARNQTVLRYRDRLSGDAFVTDVPNERALAAFQHPNVYRPAAAA